MRLARLLLAMALFGALVSISAEIVARSTLQQVRKYDDSNINHMKYGLFNVNAWKEKLTQIVLSEVQEFKLDKKNKKDLRSHVEKQLNVLIEKLDTQMREANKGSARGWLKQKFIDAFLDIEEIKKSIPDYAETIVGEMTKDESQRHLKKVIKKRIAQYLDETFVEQDMTEVNGIIARTGKGNEEDARRYLMAAVPEENANLFLLTWSLIAVSVALFVVSGFHRPRVPAPHFFICVASLFVLIYVGVTAPMIDMVAKISEFSFQLLGHHVQFDNQVVYFQSKSILDVFWILMDDEDFQMRVVGVLMITFSIIIPVFKLVSAMFYYFDVLGAQKNRFVQFLVLKSGKWSMTDVQIVAIMMAYIGFNGMVTTQFQTLKATIPQFILISTNDTTLQIGFYIFLTYVILAMLLSLMIEKKPAPKPDPMNIKQ